VTSALTLLHERVPPALDLAPRPLLSLQPLEHAGPVDGPLPDSPVQQDLDRLDERDVLGGGPRVGEGGVGEWVIARQERAVGWVAPRALVRRCLWALRLY